MDVVTIALASSMTEFEQERDKLDQRIEGLRELLEKRKIHVNFELWRKSVKWTSEKQAEFNERIRKSHFFFAIIGKRAGYYTQQEIDAAEGQFRDGGNAQPRIKIFFQDVTPDEIAPKNREALDKLKERATDEGYFVPFSKFEKIYGTIIAELIQNGAILQEWKKKCNTSLKARWTIRANRKKIDKISKADITQDSETELMLLHTENMMLSEVWHLEWKTFCEYVRFLNRRGHNEEAIETGERLEKGYAQDMDADARAKLKKLLGDCCMSQGQHETAEPYYRAALELYRELAERKENKYRADVAETCAKLAEIMVRTSRIEAAERLYRESLEYYLGDAEKYAREIGLSCRSLQKLMTPERNEETAILHRAEQRAVHCAAQGVRGQMGAVCENLCYWLNAFPCPDTAAEWMKRAETQAQEQTQDKPNDYPWALSKICWDISKWFCDHNQMEPAEILIRKSREISQNLVHKDTMFEIMLSGSCNILAWILSDTNRFKEAEQQYQKAVKISRKLAKTDPERFEPILLEYCNNLANLLKDTARYEEARQYHQEALEILRRLVKKDPVAFEPSLAVSYNNLAEVLRITAHYKEAEHLLQEALEIQRRLMTNTPAKVELDLSLSCYNLANLLENTTRYKETEQLYQESINIQTRLAQKDPAAVEPYLAISCQNYGLFLANRKHDTFTAIAYLNKAIALYAKYPHYRERMENAISKRDRYLL